ncbi:MAG TPA: redoxin domain-containing protein [Deltaproteobacteria bacterium]|nr:redoxin domain-containing protein [Deltaproteobacteria bacterium]
MSKNARPRRTLPCLFLVLLLSGLPLAGCSGEKSADTPAEAAEAAAPTPGSDSGPIATRPAAARKHEKGETAPRNPNERPIPAFEGTTLEGKRLAIRDLLGSRIVLFFFNPEVEPAAEIGQALAALSDEARDHNFAIIGIGVGSDHATLSRFVEEHAFPFPVIDDSVGEITRRLRLRSPNAILEVDPDGYMGFGIGYFPKKGDVRSVVGSELREKLRLPDRDSGEPGALDVRPAAPELGVISMATGKRLETRDLEGRAAIVIFFLHTCPHCHHALAAIKTILESIPSQQRPRLVAISVSNASPAAIRASLSEKGLDYFDPHLDPGQKAADRWGVTGGVPVIFVLDEQTRIRHRSSGWDTSRDAAILRMKLARAAGVRVPMLLDPTGYSGNDVCGICHEQEYATWKYTKHATAFDTLVTHGANRRTDCVGCHVVGFDQKGGYDFRRQPRHLEGVGCESCHGRGGPHLSPDFVPKATTRPEQHDYEPICSTCHNPQHSLGFDYATFRPRISHRRIAAMSNAERIELLGGSGPGRELLPSRADHVGSEACRSCHEKEYATWQTGPHGHAGKTLEAAGKAGEADCLACHTTAYGKPGGFRPGVPIASQPDLARVGCESCHGPGGDHVGDGARRRGTILSLGDKCDTCVILKICGSCHDDANDPGFQFKVEERIEAQRHGTIDPTTTEATDSADRELLHRTFVLLADGHPD